MKQNIIPDVIILPTLEELETGIYPEDEDWEEELEAFLDSTPIMPYYSVGKEDWRDADEMGL